MANSNLTAAKRAKKDEFYTQLTDIANELRHYKHHFRDKVVLCNCDDPYESNFFKFFALNFKEWGLRKLICTCYDGSPVAGRELSLFENPTPEAPARTAYKMCLTEVADYTGDGAIDMADVDWLLRNDKNVLTRLEGNGDFRSRECIELLQEADIVVTNPPFSLFREYVAQLVEYDKKFLIIGNLNAITYKDVFPLIKDNKMWFGPSISSGDREFGVPDSYPLAAAGCRIDDLGHKYIRVKGVRWFTNLDHHKRHEPLDLYKRYTPEEYPHYDNYDAIEVGKVSEIPMDYDGIMGVPITFLDKYCPEQFAILGITKTWYGGAIKTYEKQIQIDKNGNKSFVTKLNDGAVIKLPMPLKDDTYYVVNDEYFIQVYARILIQALNNQQITPPIFRDLMDDLLKMVMVEGKNRYDRPYLHNKRMYARLLIIRI